MSDSTLIGSDSPLSLAAKTALLTLLRAMIPASEAFNVPGADDPKIVADILATGGPALAFLDEPLAALQAGLEAQPDHSGQSIEQFRAQHGELTSLLTMLTLQCYYRDDRVMASLEMEARPPFPEGYQVEDGDYSLLDPVRARGVIYRPVPDDL